ncbi:MAG TPA: GYD domain-containing protein [Terriglobia bacterium]|jgi:uncharacterized protein with GYD domain|nr:GYD domain-containing protein [Terriglobia bacterium]
MAHYLVQISYSSEAWAALVNNPQDRQETVKPGIERLGGTIVGSWMAFGDYDVVYIIRLPDNVSAAAFSMAVSASGAVKSVKTTPLVTWEEGVSAMRKAAVAGAGR